MVVDEKTLDALRTALTAIRAAPDDPLAAGAVAPLADLAQPGVRIRLDVAATKTLGAPLITVSAPAQPMDLSRLTARQQQVAALVLEGLPNKSIAVRLGIAVATVKDHVHAILHRLEMPSRAALIAASGTRGQD